MDTLLHLGLYNAAAATVLAVPAALASRFARRPALAHALWLLVLAKLLTPPLVGVPIPWPAPAAGPAEARAVPPVSEPPAPPVAITFAAAVESGGTSLLSGGVTAEPAPPAAAIDPAAPAEATAVPWLALAGGAWLAGAAGWYLLASWRLVRFHRLLRFARPAPLELQRRVAALAGEIGLAAGPPICLVPGRLAPLVWAVGRARLVLPAALTETLPAAQLDALVAHELAHLRRRDHWVRALEFVALGLYWWLPIAWLARRALREAEEQCCDAWVVATLPGAGRTYATALVDTLDFLSEAPAVPLLASGIGEVADLKRRLTMILSGTTPRALGRRGLLAVLGLALLLPLWPSWAQEERRDRRPEPPRPEDQQKAREEVKHLQEALADKARELAEIQKKLHEAGRRLAGPPQPGRPYAIPLEGGAIPVPPPVEGEPRSFFLRKTEHGWVLLPMPPGEGFRPRGEFGGPPGGPPFRHPEGRDGDRPPLRRDGERPPHPRDGERSPHPPREGEGRGGDRLERLERQLEHVMRELEALRRGRGPGDGPPPPRRGAEGGERPRPKDGPPPPPREGGERRPGDRPPPPRERN